MAEAVERHPISRSSFVSLLVLTGLAAGLMLSANIVFPQGEDFSGSSDDLIVTVNTVRIQRRDSLEESRSFVGVVKAARASELSFGSGGQIAEILVREGDVVDRDQIIARLDGEDLEQQRDQLTTSINAAREALAQLNPDNQPSDPDTVTQRLRQLRLELDALEADVRQGRLSQPENNLRLAERVQNLEGQVALLNRNTRSQQIADQTSLVASLETELRQTDQRIAAAVLRAPFEGVIAARHVNAGSMVGAGSPVVKLVDQSRLEVWVGVPVAAAASARKGEMISVVVAGRGLSATIKAKLPEVDPTARTRTLIVELETATNEVVPGEIAVVRLERVSRISGFWVPVSALHREANGLWSVFVVAGGEGPQTVSRQHVEVVDIRDAGAFVRGKLQDQDRIISTGTHRVVPGQLVRPIGERGSESVPEPTP